MKCNKYIVIFFKILTELIPKVCQDLLFLGKGIFR
nr:MAG TPA: autophagocytosis associated protein [Caudoviricetes sp.]